MQEIPKTIPMSAIREGIHLIAEQMRALQGFGEDPKKQAIREELIGSDPSELLGYAKNLHTLRSDATTGHAVSSEEIMEVLKTAMRTHKHAWYSSESEQLASIAIALDPNTALEFYSDAGPWKRVLFPQVGEETRSGRTLDAEDVVDHHDVMHTFIFRRLLRTAGIEPAEAYLGLISGDVDVEKMRGEAREEYVLYAIKHAETPEQFREVLGSVVRFEKNKDSMRREHLLKLLSARAAETLDYRSFSPIVQSVSGENTGLDEKERQLVQTHFGLALVEQGKSKDITQFLRDHAKEGTALQSVEVALRTLTKSFETVREELTPEQLAELRAQVLQFAQPLLVRENDPDPKSPLNRERALLRSKLAALSASLGDFRTAETAIALLPESDAHAHFDAWEAVFAGAQQWQNDGVAVRAKDSLLALAHRGDWVGYDVYGNSIDVNPRRMLSVGLTLGTGMFRAESKATLDVARELYEASPRADSDSTRARFFWNDMVQAYIQLGELDKAFDTAALVPSEGRLGAPMKARLHVVKMAAEQGDFEKAIDFLGICAQEGNGFGIDDAVGFIASTVLSQPNTSPRALERLSDFVQDVPVRDAKDRTRIQDGAWSALARTLSQKGAPEMALDILRRISHEPRRASVALQCGIPLSQVGMEEQSQDPVFMVALHKGIIARVASQVRKARK